MKVIRSLSHIRKPLKNAVMAIGVFDGVHRGHQVLLKQMIKRAKAIKGTAVVMTFFPHPVTVLRPEVKFEYLVSLDHRLKLFEQMGVDVAFVVRFTKRFSRLTPESFTQRYLAKGIHIAEVFVGDDFRFGQNRSGDLKTFQSLGEQKGFKVNIVKSVKSAQRSISSTRLRKMVCAGELSAAKNLLGRPVSIFGKVVKGDGRGKGLGYPTANIEYHCDCVPPRGVYAVRVQLKNKTLKAMANIGYRPSFSSQREKKVLEVHVFDFHKKIYGQNVLVEFVKKIREEKKFKRGQDLVQQLQRDEVMSRKELGK